MTGPVALGTEQKGPWAPAGGSWANKNPTFLPLFFNVLQKRGAPGASGDRQGGFPHSTGNYCILAIEEHSCVWFFL